MRRDWQTVQAEVNEYIASISPTSVGPPLLVKQVTEKTLADKVYNWLARTFDKIKNAPRYASAADSVRRGEICRRCPYNQAIPSSCGLCKASMTRMSKGITKSRKVHSVDSYLGGCGLLHFDLKTAIHLEDDLLGEMPVEAKTGLPEQCWRR